MRAGQLDTLISIARNVTTINDYGVPSETWSTFATARAQMIQAGTEEFIRAFGASDETVIVFRSRFIDGVKNSDRLICDGRAYNIRETKELGRRRGLEIRCVAFTEATP